MDILFAVLRSIVSAPRRLAIPGLLVFLLAGCSMEPPEGVSPVTGFELDRYLGTWYEVARLDHRFERGLTDVTARYGLREDGGVAVTNRGWDTDDGAWDEVTGKAYFTGAEDTASLKVSFFGPFYGGYHVMALDEDAEDYAFAMISGPSREYLWILSRTPTLPEPVFASLVAQAEAAGFPVEELIRVDQSRNAGP